MSIIDGKALSAKIREELKRKSRRAKKQRHNAGAFSYISGG